MVTTTKLLALKFKDIRRVDWKTWLLSHSAPLCGLLMTCDHIPVSLTTVLCWHSNFEPCLEVNR